MGAGRADRLTFSCAGRNENACGRLEMICRVTRRHEATARPHRADCGPAMSPAQTPGEGGRRATGTPADRSWGARLAPDDDRLFRAGERSGGNARASGGGRAKTRRRTGGLDAIAGEKIQPAARRPSATRSRAPRRAGGCVSRDAADDGGPACDRVCRRAWKWPCGIGRPRRSRSCRARG